MLPGSLVTVILVAQQPRHGDRLGLGEHREGVVRLRGVPLGGGWGLGVVGVERRRQGGLLARPARALDADGVLARVSRVVLLDVLVEVAQLLGRALDKAELAARERSEQGAQRRHLGRQPRPRHEGGIRPLDAGVRVALEHGVEGVGGRAGHEVGEVVGRVTDARLLPGEHAAHVSAAGVLLVVERGEHVRPVNAPCTGLGANRHSDTSSSLRSQRVSRSVGTWPVAAARSSSESCRRRCASAS